VIHPDLLLQVGIRFHRDRLDKRQAISVAVIIGLMAVKLQQTQRDVLEDMPYPGWRSIDEQANQRHEGRNGSRNLPGLLQRHMARTALIENQTDRIGAVFNGAERVLGAGNTTNFNAGTHDQAIAARRQSGCKRNRITAIA